MPSLYSASPSKSEGQIVLLKTFPTRLSSRKKGNKNCNMHLFSVLLILLNTQIHLNTFKIKMFSFLVLAGKPRGSMGLPLFIQCLKYSGLTV